MSNSIHPLTSRPVCYSSGDTVELSVAERMRGFVRCPRCGKEIKVGINAKARTLPKHIDRRAA